MEESVTECSSITWRQLIKVRQWSSLDQWLITSRSVVKTLLKFSLKDSPGLRWFSIHIGVLQVFWTHRPHCNTFLCFQTCYHFITILSHRHLRLTIIIMLKLIDLCVGGVCVQAHAYMCTDAKECQWHSMHTETRGQFLEVIPLLVPKIELRLLEEFSKYFYPLGHLACTGNRGF